METLKFKCKDDFSYGGNPMSTVLTNEHSAEVYFFVPSNWIKDHIYEGYYYSGGVMCHIPAYVIKGESGNKYYFSLSDAKPTYMLFSEHFEILE